MAVLASTIWRVRAGGNNANGGGYDSGIAGAATDYSQQDTAQATGTLGTAAGTTAFTDAGAAFTSAMIGNALFIASGAGFTAGPYFITAFTSSTAVTLDRSPGTGSAAVWKVGGAWADPFVNVTVALAYIVPGNTTYIRGAGTDNPSVADYTAPASTTALVAGNNSAGMHRIIGENGRPLLLAGGGTQQTIYSASGCYFENLLVKSAGTAGATGIISSNGGGNVTCDFVNIVADQNGKDCTGLQVSGSAIGCEVYSSTPNAGAAGTSSGIVMTNTASKIVGNNIHECWGIGLTSSNNGVTLLNNIVAKCAGNGIVYGETAAGTGGLIQGNTIDGNKGHGISIATASTLINSHIIGNLITNQNQASKFGLNLGAGTTAVNDRIKSVVDFNWYYNNTSDYNNISAGPHDSNGVDPLYTNQSTQDYTLQSSSPAIAKGFPTAASPASPIGATPGWMSTIQPTFLRRGTTPSVESYNDEGAAQRIMATGGGGIPYVIGG